MPAAKEDTWAFQPIGATSEEPEEPKRVFNFEIDFNARSGTEESKCSRSFDSMERLEMEQIVFEEFEVIPLEQLHVEDASIARGSPNAASLLAAGSTGASALAGSGLILQSAAPADQSAPAAPTERVATTPDIFGRIPSDRKFNGLPAFYDAASNTLWDGEQGWTWFHESATGTTLAADLHTAREPSLHSEYRTIF